LKNLSLNASATSTPSSTSLIGNTASELLLVILTTIITVTITFVVQSYLNRPKVRGRVFEVIRAEWTFNPPNEPNNRISKAAFWAYVYLTNYHRNSIRILDYELEIDFGEGFLKLNRVYGDISRVLPETLMVRISKEPTAREQPIKNINKHLLYKDAKPVQFGNFVHGFVMFAGDISLHEKTIQKVRFTCIDVFNRKHVLRADYKDFAGLNPLLEILDVSN
jgi:hypothetical protein